MVVGGSASSSLFGSIFRKSVLRRQCRLTLTTSTAWNNLGALGGGHVRITNSLISPYKRIQAKECFQKALSRNLEFPEAMYNLGVLDCKRPQHCHSRSRFLQALERDPKNAKAWNNLGVIGGGEVKHESYNRKACFLKALELEPKYSIAWSNMGACGALSPSSVCCLSCDDLCCPNREGHMLKPLKHEGLRADVTCD